ncbi:hypothetical protein D1007_01549 [Hordeum vulgare]|nr:hypothetical protein D1007_01549 [Hordeum vulgare]
MLTLGGEILFGSLSFIIYDSAWLPDALLDTDALPARGTSHFSAVAHRVLIRQALVSYHSTPPRDVAARRKRSGRSRLQRWIKHAMAYQATPGLVAMLDSDEPIVNLFPSSSDRSFGGSDCESSRGATEILMGDTTGERAPGFALEIHSAMTTESVVVATADSISRNRSLSSSWMNFVGGASKLFTRTSPGMPRKRSCWRMRA